MPEMLEGMRRVLLRMLEVVEGVLCLQEVLEVPELPEVMRCALLFMPEALEMLDALDVMRCVLLYMLEAV